MRALESPVGKFFQVCYSVVRILQNVVNLDVNITFFYILFFMYLVSPLWSGCDAKVPAF